MKIIPLLILYLFPAFCVAGQDRLPVAVFDFRNRYLSAEQTGKLEREEAGIVDTSNLMGKGGRVMSSGPGSRWSMWFCVC